MPSALNLRRLLFGLALVYLVGLHAVVGVALLKTDLMTRFLKKLPVVAAFFKYGEAAQPPALLSAPVATMPLGPASSAPGANAVRQDLEKELVAIVERDLFVYPLSTHLALKDLIPADPIFFVGDSLIRGMNVHGVVDTAVNFGVAGDNTAGIHYRMKTYSRQIAGFDASRFMVLAIGINNLGIGADADHLVVKHLQELLARRPRGQRIVLNGIFPVDETIKPAEFSGFNKRIIAINKGLNKMCRRIPDCIFLDFGKRFSGVDGNLAKKYHVPNDPIHLSRLAYTLWEQELRSIVNG